VHFWSWLGGFFDGEGYFGIAIKRNTTLRLHFEIMPLISITSSNRKILEKIQDELHVGKITVGMKAHGHRKEVYYWYLRYRQTKEFAKRIISYLVLKKKTCRHFMDLLERIKNRDTGSVEEFLEIAKQRDCLNSRHRTNRYRDYGWFKKYFQEHSLPADFPFRDNNGRFVRGHPSVNKGKRLSGQHKTRISLSHRGINWRS